MADEFINYAFAKKVLEKMVIPFRRGCDGHYVKFPKDFLSREQVSIDDEVSNLLGAVGWKVTSVVIAKSNSGEPFYAYKCEPA